MDPPQTHATAPLLTTLAAALCLTCQLSAADPDTNTKPTAPSRATKPHSPSAMHLPKPVQTFLQSINNPSVPDFISTFADDAIVNDAGRKIEGAAAIRAWAEHEIFAVNVTLELLNTADRGGQTVITVKVDGTFDRTGLPNPLIMEQLFTLTDDKITALTCQLAPAPVAE